MAEGITKKSLADALVATFDLTKKAALEIVDLLFDEITAGLKDGKTIDIAGFGKFVVKTREAREGINPRTMEKITIEASKVPGFKASKVLKDALK